MMMVLVACLLLHFASVSAAEITSAENSRVKISKLKGCKELTQQQKTYIKAYDETVAKNLKTKLRDIRRIQARVRGERGGEGGGEAGRAEHTLHTLKHADLWAAEKAMLARHKASLEMLLSDASRGYYICYNRVRKADNRALIEQLEKAIDDVLHASIVFAEQRLGAAAVEEDATADSDDGDEVEKGERENAAIENESNDDGECEQKQKMIDGV